MNETNKKIRFVHLHTHSHYSMLDGMGKIPNLVAKAKADGQPALAITDHGVMHGAVEFYEECEKQGIKPIIGCEVYVAPRTLKDKVPRTDAHPYHLILLAKDETGYKNLMKLTSIAHLEGYYYKPRVDKNVLKKYSGGLIACSACVQGEIVRKSLEDIEKGRSTVKEYIGIFGKENLYLEVQKHKLVEQQEEANRLIFQLAEEFNLKVVATNDIHYVNSDDDVAQDALICLQTSRVMSDTNRLSMVGDDYSMLSTEQMQKNFADHPEVISNTLEVMDKCNIKLKLGEIIIPDFPVPEGHTLATYFEERAYLGLNWRYGNEKIEAKDLPRDRKPTAKELKITQEILDRAFYEMDVIEKMGYQGYFLIVADYTQWAKDHGIAVGPGRGSGAGSIITYALNITELNPLDYALLFERFLNPDRISMPDIDMDFADSRRHEVIEYVSKKYGRDHVAQIITFGTMAARMAVRDVGRVLGMTYSEVDIIAKLIPLGTNFKDAMSVPEFKELYNGNQQVKQCIDIAMKLEGVVRHSSMHAAGVVISKEPLTEYCPLQEAQKGDISTLTQYEGTIIEHLGLLKMDFLGLSNLSIIQNALSIIRKTQNVDLDLSKIDIEDKETYELLSRAETTGVFQLESDGMKRYLKELKPTVFEDIIAMVALYRPGPMQWIQEFVDRKHGRKPVVYAHPLAKAALENTYGIIVYQEQVMQMSKDMAGFTGGQADTLRKAMGKKIKELMDKMGPEFINGCIKNGVDQKIAEDLFQAMQDFAQYAFNKSHAACYALVAYQTAYLKAHFPSEFMASLLTSNKDDLDKLAIDISECKRMGINVLPPSINESFEDFGVVKENGNIRFGLSAIKNVGFAVAEEIVKEHKKNGNFLDLKDFVTRLGPKVINKKSLESLAQAGGLDDLGERQELLFNMEKILSYASMFQKNKSAGQTSLFGGDTQIETARIDLEPAKPADKKQRLAWERELLGMYVSEHPLSGVAHIIEPHRTKRLVEIKTNIDGQYVRVSGIITSLQKILTRQNQNMIFAKLEDTETNIEILVFPKLLADTATLWQNDKIVAVEGFVSFKDGAPKILAEGIYEISEKTPVEEFIPKEKKRNNFGQWKKNGEGNSGNTSYSSGPVPQIAKNVVIQIPKDSDRSILMEIKEILNAHSGGAKVTLKIPSEDGSFKNMNIKNTADPSLIVLRKLKELVGKDNISLI